MVEVYVLKTGQVIAYDAEKLSLTVVSTNRQTTVNNVSDFKVDKNECLMAFKVTRIQRSKLAELLDAVLQPELPANLGNLLAMFENAEENEGE